MTDSILVPIIHHQVEMDKSALQACRQTVLASDESSISGGMLLQKTNASSMINFSSSWEQDSMSSQFSAPNKSGGSLESSFIPSSGSRTNPDYYHDQSSSSSLPNLELTLAAPQPLNQSKPSAAACLLAGTITVV